MKTFFADFVCRKKIPIFAKGKIYASNSNRKRGNNSMLKPKAKPFIKWVGGKTQLIEQINGLLPHDFCRWNKVKYIEPFVGGGAMLFFMLQRFENIHSAVINDINPDLMRCYLTVRDHADDLIRSLEEVEGGYLGLETEEKRKEYFLQARQKYNCKNFSDIENTTLFIFLNKTCFNGLYRVNKKGQFNVPFGRYRNPQICCKETIMQDSELLQKVEITTGDFEQTFLQAEGNTFFYFDPPYRPLTSTSSFTDYSKENFDDLEQMRLKQFCDKVSQSGYAFMLSNSDPKTAMKADNFFDDLYNSYDIHRVLASRSINSVGSKRGKLTEILVRNFGSNYSKTQNDLCSMPTCLVAEQEQVYSMLK